MNAQRFSGAALFLSLMLFAAQLTSFAQPTGNPLQEIWESLQDLQDPGKGAFPYADIIEADPVRIGTVYVGRSKGVEQAMWRPVGSVSPDRSSTTITINGRNAIIRIDADRSDALVAPFSFQFEVMEIKNVNGVKYSKINQWDHWPNLKTTSSGSTVSTYIDVGDATEVVGVIRASSISEPGFPSIQCADGQFAVKIERDPNCMALGSFSIPVFPISILYAPSPGKNGKTTVEYLDEHAVSTKVSTTIVNEQSETVPTNYSGMGGLNAVLSGFQAAGTVAGVINPAAGTIINKCVGIIKDALGTFDETTETGTRQQVVDGALILSSSSLGQTVGGLLPDGTLAQPGSDDRFVLLRGLRLAWIGDGAKNPILVSLGARQIEMIPVKNIANDIALLEAKEPPSPPQAGPADSGHVGDLEFGPPPTETKSGQSKFTPRPLDSKAIGQIHSAVKDLVTGKDQLTNLNDLGTLRSLFIMDPLAYMGSDVDFGRSDVNQQFGDRFQVAYFATQWGEGEELSTEFPVNFETVSLSTYSHAQTGTQFQTYVEDDKPGWFGKYFLGYQTRKLKTSSSMSGSTETAVSNSRKVKLHWERSSDGVVLRAYYDGVFGTYIFREVPNTYEQVSGVATDDNGVALVNQMLKFEINGKSVLARTDANGKYVVYSTNSQPGRGKITIGSKVSTLVVSPARKRGIAPK
jgi:hypothetical protein